MYASHSCLAPGTDIDAWRFFQSICHDRLADWIGRGPAHTLRGLLRIYQYTIMSAATIAQHAALEALARGEKHVQEVVSDLTGD